MLEKIYSTHFPTQKTENDFLRQAWSIRTHILVKNALRDKKNFEIKSLFCPGYKDNSFYNAVAKNFRFHILIMLFLLRALREGATV